MKFGLVLPFRNPFLAAKAAATVQVLSDHRLILGVGVGYQEAEFDALGVPYRKRGALTDEALETIRLAWQGSPVVMRSALVSREQFRDRTAHIRKRRLQLGKTGPFDIAPGSPLRPQTTTRSDAECFLDTTRQLEACGANWVWTNLPAPSRAGFIGNVAWFSEEVVAACAAA